MSLSSGGFWVDGDWFDWDEFGDEEDSTEFVSTLAQREYEAELRWRFPKAENIDLIPIFEDLLCCARDYHFLTGRYLDIYGDIGELYGAIKYGIVLKKNKAQGSDGTLGNDHVEIKTISPHKKKHGVEVKASGNFNKLLVVNIDQNFNVQSRMIDRKSIRRQVNGKYTVEWEQLTNTG